MKPWWHVIRDSRFDRGATIPYLIAATRVARGAQVTASADSYQADLFTLLTEMRDEAPVRRWVAIEMCPTLETFIALRYTSPRMDMNSIQSPKGNGRALYYPKGLNLRRPDLESLHGYVWREHKDVILAGRFSREQTPEGDYEWTELTETEGREILLTISNPRSRTRFH
jgi:hypothetical protein